MDQPWFDPNMYAWIPGTALGVFGGLMGTLSGTLAPRGQAKRIVLGLYGFGLAASIILLVIGIVAYASGQPYGIWYGFGLAGVIGTAVIGSLLPVVVKQYRKAELKNQCPKI